MKNITQDLIKAFRRIDKYGKSEMAVDTYIRYICIDRTSMKRLNRNLAFAELMSRLAPPKEHNQWYTAGLLNDIMEKSIPGIGKSPGIIKALLMKAKVSPGTIRAIENYRSMSDPRRWSPMIAAMNFAETHVSETGDLLTTAECCEKHSGKKRCNECMYARYFFSQTDMDKKAEAIITELKAELEKRSNEEGREEQNGIQQRRMEERSQEANAIASG